MSLLMLIDSILQELEYCAKDSFHCPINKKTDVSVFPFISDSNPSQAYLMLEMQEDTLGYVLRDGSLAAIARAFRGQECYQTNMAKNTSLLILNPCQENSNRNSPEKLKIEDDPLYFKKYVLSYTSIEEEKVSEYVASQKEQHGIDYSCITMIQEYLWMPAFFGAYKANHQNEPVYTILAEAATKLPILPLATSGTQELKPVNAFLQENLEAAAQRRSPVNVEAHILDALLQDINDWKDADTDSIVERYQAILQASTTGDES